MDWNLIEKYTTIFIRNYVHQSGFKDVVIGVSGGLDSAVVATLCVRALGAEHVFGLMLPYKTSSPDSILHAREICKHLNISSDVVNITPMVDAYFDSQTEATPLRIGNFAARMRMSVLYDYSVQFKSLVAGTSNKSEYLVGYCTQYGDGAAAFEPIADLYKTQVFEFARYLGVPDVIINKKPSADLWAGQTDEGEIGITYREMDEILNLWFDHGYSLNEIVEKGYSRENVNKIIGRFNNSKFKRSMPPQAMMPMLTELDKQ